jgi:murein DD-endopeptidase MepM/ murein hydrolase activator NlpD
MLAIFLATASVSLSAKSLDSDPADEVVEPASRITVGRALDLEGTPIRLVTGPMRGANNFGSLRPSWTGPASLPAGSPVRGVRLSSGYGNRWHPLLGYERFHSGIDFAASTGAPVAATAAGAVQIAGWCSGYGLCVIVDHGGGYQTVYGHLSRIDVSGGQTVASGQTIGLVGSTGLSTGPHLHYEIRFLNRPVNPSKFL